MNIEDQYHKLRHFLEPNKMLSDLKNYRGKDDLWDILQRQLPLNRQLQGLPSANIPLSTTLNNIPYTTVDTKENSLVHYDVIEGTPFVTAVSTDGVLTIYNSELALVEVCRSNFKEKLVKPVVAKLFEVSKKHKKEIYRNIMEVLNQDSDEDDV